jgi:hypothetical protein
MESLTNPPRNRMYSHVGIRAGHVIVKCNAKASPLYMPNRFKHSSSKEDNLVKRPLLVWLSPHSEQRHPPPGVHVQGVVAG